MQNKIAANLVEMHEGRRQHVYRCTAGKLTVGVGHNLEAKAMPDCVIDLLFACYLADAENDCKHYKYFAGLNEVRQAALIDMSFQLGKSRLSAFKKMHANLNAGDYKGAARECLNSLYANQTPRRAQTIADLLERGTIE